MGRFAKTPTRLIRRTGPRRELRAAASRRLQGMLRGGEAAGGLLAPCPPGMPLLEPLSRMSVQSRDLEDRRIPGSRAGGLSGGSSTHCCRFYICSCGGNCMRACTSHATSAEGIDPDEAAQPVTDASHTRKLSPLLSLSQSTRSHLNSKRRRKVAASVGDLRQLGSKRGGISTHPPPQARAKRDDRGEEG